MSLKLKQKMAYAITADHQQIVGLEDMTKFKHIRFNKIDLSEDDDYSISRPYAHFVGRDVLLRYHIQRLSDSVNEVRFINTLMYRIGDPNDEGFYSDGKDKENSTIYNCVNFPDLEFGGFDEISGVEWKRLMSPGNGFVRNQELESAAFGKMRHYLHFLRDATFECIAEGYAEIGLQPSSVLREEQSEYTDM